MNENNLETVTSLSSDLSTRENITIQLEELDHRVIGLQKVRSY